VNVEEVAPAPCTWSLADGVVVPIPTFPEDVKSVKSGVPLPAPS